MEAKEINLDTFLSSQKTQFVIPVYQRNYDWSENECKQLLFDILEIGSNNKTASHFIGSLVYVHHGVFSASRMKDLIIIDGQQRLTTISLIYIVLANLLKEINDEYYLSDDILNYLTNKVSNEDRKLKLVSTDNNNKVLKYLLRNDPNEEFTAFSRIISNYNYFKEKINKENYKIIWDGLSKLMIIDISLDSNKDNPQRIFESLNSTGLELSQSDLIRNYILMGLDRENQNKIYENYWEIIENLSKDELTNTIKLSDFIRDFLTLENKNIPNKGKVYIEFKNKYHNLDMNMLEKVLGNIKSLSKNYNKLINPKNESDKDIRVHLEYINRLEINVTYPFLMKVYDDYNNNLIDKKIFISILELIQSFVWRRFIVGLATNALNKVFMNLYDKIDKNNYLSSIQKAILKKSGTQKFPRNQEVINALKEKDVYNIKSKNRVYFLERLENFENRELVNIENNTDITIEHIFPQNPDIKWKMELGDIEYNFIKENYLNTISNITLSGNNGKLSNKIFSEKRDMNIDNLEQGYKFSKLWLNRYISELEVWNRNEIEKRFEVISERFLKIWNIPDIEIDLDSENQEVNIFDSENPKGKKLEYAIFKDKKLEIREVSKLYLEIMKDLFLNNPQIFFVDLGSKIGLTKNPIESNTRQASALNETYFIESNIDSNTKFDKIKYALTLFDLEDELLIKYTENKNEK